MIDYEEELKKFEPCLDVADAEGAIYERRRRISWIFFRKFSAKPRVADG